MALDAEGRRAPWVGAAEEHGQRCPYSRDFSPAFAACPAYQPVSFIAADSWYRPLGPVLTCLHLAVGDVGPRTGRFYPRCALGTDRERLQWVARVTPERLEIARVLQEEFDRSTWPAREQLFEAKARFLVSPASAELRVQLEQRAQTFLAACSRFFAERRVRFQEAGLPIGPLMPLIADWVRAWTDNPQVDEATIGDRRRRAFTPTPESRGRARALPSLTGEQMQAAGRPASPAGVQAGVSSSLLGTADTPPSVYKDAILHIWRSADCSTVTFTGEIDGSNVDAVSESLLLDVGDAEDIHVDLNGVSFCDIGGLRAFVRASLDLAPRRRLVLRGLPCHLHTAVQLVGWAELPGLVILGDDDSSENAGHGSESVQFDTNTTQGPR